MKTAHVKLPCLVILGSLLLGLFEGCHHKNESKPAQAKPAQTKVDKAVDDF